MLYWVTFYENGSYFSGMAVNWEQVKDLSFGAWTGEEQPITETPSHYWEGIVYFGDL